MSWAVCIVGKISAAKRMVEKRFEEGCNSHLTETEQKSSSLAKEIVYLHLAAAEKIGGNKYISITAKGNDDPESTEIQMAIRLLPGFVE